MTDETSYNLGRLFESLCNMERQYNRINGIKKLAPLTEFSENLFMRFPVRTLDRLMTVKLKHIRKWYSTKKGMSYPYIMNDVNKEMERTFSREMNIPKVVSVESYICGRISFRKEIKEKIEKNSIDNKENS